jgi:hypothetical protein
MPIDPALKTIGSNLISAALGGVAARCFSRRTTRNDRLRAAYQEWAEACHEFISRANRMGAAISNAVERTPGAVYQTEAIIYFSREPGASYYREYVEFHRRLEQAEFKVCSSGDSYVNYTFLTLVADITRQALKIDVLHAQPKIGKLIESLLLFTAHLLPQRFDAPWWKRAWRALRRSATSTGAVLRKKFGREKPAQQLPAN